MANFRYKVRDKFGKLLSGVIAGETKDGVAAHFESKGYIPISIDEEKEETSSAPLFAFRRVHEEDMNLFNRQLVTLIEAGVPLLAALNAVEKQTKSRVLRSTIQIITKDIEGGSSLSDAMKRHPRIFDELYINTIKAGETSGALGEIFLRLADLGEHEADTKAKISAATRYPIVALTVLITGFFILVTYVIPKFSGIFNSYKETLPLPTRILIGINYFITHYWFLAIVGSALIVLGFRQILRTDVGRRVWDSFKLRVPIFGPLFFMIMMSRFCRMMSILLRCGVPILSILEMVSHAAGNKVISEAIDEVAKSVNQGKGMAEPMARTKVFSPMVTQMVSIGEESGQVDQLLMRVSDYYDSQSSYMIKNLTTLIEPILVVILGCVVLLMALAVFLPMWNMVGLFRG